MRLTDIEKKEIQTIFEGLLLVWRLEHPWNRASDAIEKTKSIRNKWQTEDELEAFAYDIWISNYRRRERLLKEADKRLSISNQGWEPCLGITFNLLESYTDIEYREIWDKLKSWRHKMIIGSLARSEFFGRSGKWNPHIHIWTPLTGRTQGKIRQALDRKFGKYKFNINILKGHSNTLDYVKGIKTLDKAAAMARDAEYRTKFNYETTIEI